MTEPSEVSGAIEGAPNPEGGRVPKVQRVTLQSKGTVTVPGDDPRVANLVRMGLTEVEARAAVAAVNW